MKQKKQEVQERFRTEVGLIVDVPTAEFWNTNDGNSNRRFFADHELSSIITSVDVNLVYRLKIIFEALSSGYKINVPKFEQYATETAELYVQVYSWYPMFRPSTRS